MLRYIKLILICSIVLTLGLFVYQSDWTAIANSIWQLRKAIPWILLSNLIAYFFGSAAWKCCISDKETNGLTYWHFFTIRLVGDNISLLNPTNFIGGEGAKAHMLTQHNVDSSQALSSVVLYRIIFVISQVILFFLFSIIIIIQHAEYRNDTIILLTILSFALLIIGLLFRLLIHSNNNLFTNKIKVINRYIEECKQIIKTKYNNDRGPLLISFSLCTVHWIFISIELYIVLLFLGVEVTIPEVVFMEMGIIIFKSFGAIIPGQLGVEELCNKLFLRLISVTSNTVWISISLIRRARQLFWIVVSLALYLFMFHSTRSKTRKNENFIYHS